MKQSIVHNGNIEMSDAHHAATVRRDWGRDNFLKTTEGNDLAQALASLHKELHAIIGPRKSIFHPRTFWGLQYKFHTAGEAIKKFDKPFSHKTVRDDDSMQFGFEVMDRRKAAENSYGIRIAMVGADGFSQTYHIKPQRMRDGGIQFSIAQRYLNESWEYAERDIDTKVPEEEGFRYYGRDQVKAIVSQKLDEHLHAQRKPGKVGMHGAIVTAVAGAAAFAAVTILPLDAITAEPVAQISGMQGPQDPSP